MGRIGRRALPLEFQRHRLRFSSSKSDRRRARFQSVEVLWVGLLARVVRFERDYEVLGRRQAANGEGALLIAARGTDESRQRRPSIAITREGDDGVVVGRLAAIVDDRS